jgi:hypothetical protein
MKNGIIPSLKVVLGMVAVVSVGGPEAWGKPVCEAGYQVRECPTLKADSVSVMCEEDPQNPGNWVAKGCECKLTAGKDPIFVHVPHCMGYWETEYCNYPVVSSVPFVKNIPAGVVSFSEEDCKANADFACVDACKGGVAAQPNRGNVASGAGIAANCCKESSGPAEY